MAPTEAEWLDQVGSVLETLNQGVVISDEDRRIVFANSMFLEMGKMSVENILGRSVMDLYPGDEAGRLREFIARREVQGRAQYEFYIPQSDGGRLPVEVTSRRVFGVDGRAYGIITATDISDQKRIQAELSEANSLLLERQHQMEEELQLAERVQQSLAPKGLIWSGVSVESHYQPASSIGGDYGLVIPGDGRLDVVVCDVSGHGISSALVANRIYSETMAQIERGADLGSMLRHLNHFAVQNLASSSFYFTLAAVRFHQSRGCLQFAGAGHPPAIVIRRGKSPLLLESTSMILGLFENAVGAESGVETELQTGDRVVIYTDGLTESFNAQREMLGVDGLQEIAAEAASLPLAEMKNKILNRVAAWRHGHAQDDISLVLLEIS
ncbi:MAG: SpoIIE family protein phosphatase [Candidatus Acidiferrum sp.]